MYNNDGTNQNERKGFVIHDDFLNIDELTFEQLVCYATDLAKNIPFFSLNNVPNGTWNDIFTEDEIVVICEIVVLDISAYEKDFNSTLRGDFYSNEELFYQKSVIILSLIQKIDSWYRRLQKIDNFLYEGLYKSVSNVILSKIRDEFYDFIQLLEKYDLDFKQEIDPLSKIWKNASDGSSINLREDEDKFKEIFYACFNAIKYLKELVFQYYDKSFVNGVHAPHLGLFFSFLKIFIKVKNQINSFPEKYLNFYYDDILKLKPGTYLPDSTYLLFSLKTGFDNFFIPKGTRFIAGKTDSGENIYFLSEDDAVINKAKIGELSTLFCDNDEHIWPHCNCTSVYYDEMPIFNIGNFDSSDKHNMPLFGGIESNTKTSADIGFIISNKVLELAEGDRRINVDLCFSEKSFKVFISRIEHINGDFQDLLLKMLSKMFVIYVATEQGWYTIENYSCECSLSNSSLIPYSFRVQFSLSIEDPALTGMPLDLVTYSFENSASIKFLMNQQAYLYPYSYIFDLEIEKIRIETDSCNLKNNLVFNELGQVDTTKPFYPLGVIPKVNSYFIVGNYEMSRKNISKLDVQVKWDNMPDTDRGFLDYFADYGENISKIDYKCNISFLNNGSWYPEEEDLQQQFDFFTSKLVSINDPKEKINPCTELEAINPFFFKPDYHAKSERDFHFSNKALGGFFKIKLTAPVFAFGHQKYPECITRITMKNTKLKEPKSLPNIPLSPVAVDLSLHYTASAEIDFVQNKSEDAIQFYHLHPFGFTNQKTAKDSESVNLLPKYTDSGYLFIGLKDAEPNMTVSLLFNLLDDSISDDDSDMPEFSWEYLSDNTWQPFSKINIVSDSTDNFLSKGIIKIILPGDINKENTLMSNEFHWIRISARGNLQLLCNAVSVTTQAIKVTRQDNKGMLTDLDCSIKKGTITKSEKLLAGISKTIQVVNSFNGKPQESREQLKVRIGERLVHKNRAVTAWDYEHLILEKFSNIYKVKCIPHINSKNEVCPGNVVIAVIEKTEPINIRVDYEPMVSISNLQKIKLFVKGVASSFASIEVRNPVYERVQVRCAIKLKEGLDAGYFINSLNKELIDYLTPWQTNGKNEPGFGKHIKCSDVLSFIQSLDFVEYATDFSMLHISRDCQSKYYLYDTANSTSKEYHYDQEDSGFSTPNTKILKPEYPWGILISTEIHALRIINEKIEVRPCITGIDELSIGDNFIIK